MILAHSTKEFIYATSETFDNKNFKQLPPQLKQRLVEVTLEPLFDKFSTFFENLMDNDTLASPVLLRKILTSLHVKIFDDC